MEDTGIDGKTEFELSRPSRRLHTIRDVCDEGRISPATAWRLIGRGVLKTVKIGRRTLVTEESLERLIVQGAR
jgi:hypothetical protein